MTKQQPLLKQVFMEAIPFINWARLSDEDVAKLGVHGIKSVFISPDVHSLHLVWDEGNGVIGHEIADYPYDNTVTVFDFLASEVGDDTWELIEGQGVYEVLSDYKDWTPENTPTVTLARLQEIEQQKRGMLSIFIWLESAADIS